MTWNVTKLRHSPETLSCTINLKEQPGSWETFLYVPTGAIPVLIQALQRVAAEAAETGPVEVPEGGYVKIADQVSHIRQRMDELAAERAGVLACVPPCPPPETEAVPCVPSGATALSGPLRFYSANGHDLPPGKVTMIKLLREWEGFQPDRWIDVTGWNNQDVVDRMVREGYAAVVARDPYKPRVTAVQLRRDAPYWLKARLTPGHTYPLNHCSAFRDDLGGWLSMHENGVEPCEWDNGDTLAVLAPSCPPAPQEKVEPNTAGGEIDAELFLRTHADLTLLRENWHKSDAPRVLRTQDDLTWLRENWHKIASGPVERSVKP